MNVGMEASGGLATADIRIACPLHGEELGSNIYNLSQGGHEYMMFLTKEEFERIKTYLNNSLSQGGNSGCKPEDEDSSSSSETNRFTETINVADSVNGSTSVLQTESGSSNLSLSIGDI